MKKLIIATFFAASLLAPVASQAGGTDRLIDHASVDFPASTERALAPDNVRAAIAEVGLKHGWAVTAEEPGKLRLSNTIRNTFKVVIDVSYSASGMQVDYVSSENLNYKLKHDVPYIHPKYNKWVNLLMQETKARLSS